MKPGETVDPSKGMADLGPRAASARMDTDATEAEWVARARGGDRAAFAALVGRHRDRAYTLALRIVRVPAEAEEVAQDAFVRVWRALPGFRGEAAFSTWLHAIVVRRALDRAATLRTRRAREVALDATPEPVDVGIGAPDLETRARRARLERLMATLTDAQRAVVTLYYLADRSVDEVAGTLGMPVNTVKTHLSRARAAMRAGWEREEDAGEPADV
jgi:RNA polymerase sigma-70 factor (ECF subfamily)